MFSAYFLSNLTRFISQNLHCLNKMPATHPIKYEDVPEMAKKFEDDARIPVEISALPTALNLSQKARTRLAANQSPEMYLKSMDLLETFVGEKGVNATYEELIRALKERTLIAAADEVESILNKKLSVNSTAIVNLEGNQISV